MKLEAFTSHVVFQFSPKLSLRIPHLVSSSANFSWNPRNPTGSWLPSSKVPWTNWTNHPSLGSSKPLSSNSRSSNSSWVGTSTCVSSTGKSLALCVFFCRENIWKDD